MFEEIYETFLFIEKYILYFIYIYFLFIYIFYGFEFFFCFERDEERFRGI